MAGREGGRDTALLARLHDVGWRGREYDYVMDGCTHSAYVALASPRGKAVWRPKVGWGKRNPRRV